MSNDYTIDTVGIHFGTTNCRIGAVNPINLKPIICDPIPCCIWKSPATSNIYVGIDAYDHVGSHPEPIIYIKRSLSNQTFRITDEEITSEQIFYYIFNEAKRQIQIKINNIDKKLRLDITNVVVAIPTKYDDSQIVLADEEEKINRKNYLNSLIEALRLANIKNVHFIPYSCAITYYCINYKISRGLVFYSYLGGGLLETSLIKIDENKFEIIQTCSDDENCGINIDRDIANILQKQISEEGYCFDLKINDNHDDKIKFDKLKTIGEIAKKGLSKSDEFRVTDLNRIKDKIGNTINIEILLKQAELRKILTPIFEKTAEISVKLIEQAYEEHNDLEKISYIVFAGGSCNIPLIQEMLYENLNNNSLIKNYLSIKNNIIYNNPENSVILGTIKYITKILKTKDRKKDDFFSILDLPEIHIKKSIKQPLKILNVTEEILPFAADRKESILENFNIYQEIPKIYPYIGLIETYSYIKLPCKLGDFTLLKSLTRNNYYWYVLAIDTRTRDRSEFLLGIPIYHPLKGEYRKNFEYVKKIWDELKNISKNLNHPNILRLVDTLRINEKQTHIHPFEVFLSEYLAGGDLRSSQYKLSRNITTILHILYNLIVGVKHIHSKEIIHGDLTPEKIYLSPEFKEVKIGGFEKSIWQKDVSSKGGLNSMLKNDINNLFSILLYLFTGKYIQNIQIVSKNLESEIKNINMPNWLNQLITEFLSSNVNIYDIHELHDKVNFHVSPSKQHIVTVEAVYLHQEKQIRLKFTDKDNKNNDYYSFHLDFLTIKEIQQLWIEIGDHAIERMVLSYDLLTNNSQIEKLNNMIHNNLKLISKTAVRNILPRIEEKIKKKTYIYFEFQYDQDLESLPYELFEIEGSNLCQCFPISRSPNITNKKDYNNQIQKNNTIRILIIKNPCGDLPQAENEGNELKSKFTKLNRNNFEIEVIDSTYRFLQMKELIEEGEFQIIHFAGHVLFSENKIDYLNNGWLLKIDGDYTAVLTKKDFEDIWSDKPPLLIFANACNSATQINNDFAYLSYYEATNSLAHSILKGGVCNYIGTTLFVPDSESTLNFASVFYDEFFSGNTISQAVLEARKYCIKKYGKEDLTWARYVLYGDPLSYIKGYLI
ncbi:MAG: Hsp70 family protein [Candidatus Lokiarchaeota archaeon]|nr:Hsp70 family protein [Candidatus Lokiarchaeota archaeon]